MMLTSMFHQTKTCLKSNSSGKLNFKARKKQKVENKNNKKWINGATKDVNPWFLQTSKMDHFGTIVNIVHLFTIVTELSILDFYTGPVA